MSRCIACGRSATGRHHRLDCCDAQACADKIDAYLAPRPNHSKLESEKAHATFGQGEETAAEREEREYRERERR